MHPVVRAAARTFNQPPKKLRDAINELTPIFRDSVNRFDDPEVCYAAFACLVAIHYGEPELCEYVETRRWAEDEWLEVGLLLVPLFDRENETIEHLEGGWAVLGGMASHQPIDFVQAYKRAADQLVDAIGSADPTWETVYPALFLYRHAVELAMKLAKPQTGHKFAKLAEDHPNLDADSTIVRWANLKLEELQWFDPKGTRFRYSDEQAASDEQLISLHHVRSVVTQLLRVFDVSEV